MFKAKLKDSKIVKGIFEAVGSIISETRLKVDPAKGLNMTAMDGSHICLVNLTLKKEDLDEFTSDGYLELGINLEDLVKIIKRSGTDDEITFSMHPTEKKLVIEMKRENGKKSRKFTIALIDIDYEEINMQSLESMTFDNKCTCSTEFLDEAIKDAEIFSEVLQVKVKDTLIFSTEGSIGDMEYVLAKEELTEPQFTAESEGSFAIQFLKNIMKISAVSKSFNMNLKTDAPLKMVFKIMENSEISYHLAPRVEEETDTMYQQ